LIFPYRRSSQTLVFPFFVHISTMGPQNGSQHVSIASGDTVDREKNAAEPFLHPEEAFNLNREDEVRMGMEHFLENLQLTLYLCRDSRRRLDIYDLLLVSRQRLSQSQLSFKNP
jgi:hypothetical protein